ncbi:hypothetical protein RUM43_012230 [Polyplax serrata]|uniref:G-patch domain-containing protein n=1 Tax=Polyplax serrata TaxID=468196 RepID=A0AAN8P3D3_POLSC
MEDEVESFEVTDYDLENEFNFKRGKKMTKNERIYGIWAENESSGDEGGSSRRPAFRGGKKVKNYTAPIGFVAGGIQQSGKKTEAEKKKGESDESDDDDAKDGLRGKSSRRIKNSSSEESEEENVRSFRQNYDNPVIHDEIAGMRKKKNFVNKTLMQKGVGNWEKHTKGIGAKLLLQMGYEPGKGLGKELQGISAPIEAKLRKGRGAIGAYGPEVAQKIAELHPDDADKKEVTQKLSRWRKDDETANKRVKYVFKSIDEVIEQGNDKLSLSDGGTMSKVKVIDMTGPQQRVLSGYHAISRQQRPSDEWETRKEMKFSNFALPELLHNLNLLVDMCEQDIIENDRKNKYVSDKIVALEHETKQLDKICNGEEIEIIKLEKLIEMMEDLTHSSENKTLSLDRAALIFRQLQEDFYEEYKMYEMTEFAIIIVTPLLKDYLSSWQPLENPGKPLNVIKEWKDILGYERSSVMSTLTNQDPFGKLIWHAWIPSIRFAITNWDCRKPEPVVSLIDVWMGVLPRWIIDSILEQIILSRITVQVHEWDPMTDTIPIHAWIHPWLPFLNARLDSVIYPMIRHKLSLALAAWHPSDRSAKFMLLPWNNVFTKGDMDSFLVRNILPKLGQILDEFIINPQHQVLDQHWKWVMEWEELMPVHSMATIMEKHFFPKWIQVLSMWLNHTPNYDQVTSWYIGWKSQFPESLLKQPNIKEQFKLAQDLMNRSVENGQIPGGMESLSYLKNVERDTSLSSSHSASSRLQSLLDAVRTGSQGSVSLKSLLADRCKEKSIVFVPIPNKSHEGLPVYRCGNIQVYFDRNVVFVSQNRGVTWAPQSLALTLDMAEKRN